MEGQLQVMQGDVVRSSLRREDLLGWICCITPESDEGHVYWQPSEDAPAMDTREPLRSLKCVDRALIPGDVVRRSQLDSGKERREGMGMVVGTEVTLDLVLLQEGRQLRSAVPASSLRHHMPIRLTSWVVHRTEGWLGRVQSWEEELVVCFKGSSGCRCRIKGANMKHGIAISTGFYRDFFPGLSVSFPSGELRPGSALDCEWLTGNSLQALSALGITPEMSEQRVEGTVEEVRTGPVRVDWLAQVPLTKGWSSQRPPPSDGCSEESLIFLLGEAECSSRWALGDRLMTDGALAEVCGLKTFVDVRWQDDSLSVRLPALDLQLCNPDAFSFFPSEFISQRIMEGEATTTTSTGVRAGSPLVGPARGTSEPTGNLDRLSRRDMPPVGYVVRADPETRMVTVRWLRDPDKGHEKDSHPLSEEEEWSAFDLQINPEWGFRLGDAVIRCRDWEEGPSALASPSAEAVPRVGQVLSLEASMVRVRWLDGTVCLHGPRELYRVGDEDWDSESDVAAGEESAQAAGTETCGADDLQGADGGPVTKEATCEMLPSPAAPEVEETASKGEADAEPSEDIIWDTNVPSDHHFLSGASVAPGPGVRVFIRRVQNEWSVLRRGLPSDVWVHVYPDRMELLRACLVGAQGTPYSDALFFFDVHLPPTYPSVPPQVKFWSFGENLNPNLYENGKVCLSLLGTWGGKESESWSAERSNLLQVLVSIMALVLNTEPYYNEPGFERERDTPQGGLRSQRYNESVALSSYHLMLRVLKAPPSDFGKAVQKHFFTRRTAILTRARQLCSEELPDASEGFRKSLAALLPRLEEALPTERGGT